MSNPEAQKNKDGGINFEDMTFPEIMDMNVEDLTTDELEKAAEACFPGSTTDLGQKMDPLNKFMNEIIKRTVENDKADKKDRVKTYSLDKSPKPPK